MDARDVSLEEDVRPHGEAVPPAPTAKLERRLPRAPRIVCRLLELLA